MFRGTHAFGAALAATALLLSACQSANQDAIEAEALACPPDSECYDEIRPVGPGSTLRVESGEFYFEILDGVAIDGPVTVELVNDGDALHNFRIDAAAGENKKVEAGPHETDEGVLELFGGTSYVYYCDIPGHRQQGMEGELTVYLDEETARAEAGADDESDARETETEGGPSPAASPEDGGADEAVYADEPSDAEPTDEEPTEASTEG